LKANIQNGIYKLKNNYFKFYFRFIFPNLSELEFGDVEGIYENAIYPLLNEYTSYIFEDVCIQYMRKLNKSNGLPIRFIKIGRWWDKKNEIDILALDSKDGMIFGECKWKNSKVGLKELNSLIEKSLTLEEKINEKYYFLFSKSGFDQELQESTKNNKKVKLVSVQDILNL
jgi:AAA+ ATPase superfamily predicted ATPase